MIGGVKQHKWWGQDEEGRSYHHDDKPKFAPFVKKLVGVDINTPVAPLLKSPDLDIPSSRLEKELRDTLVRISGAKHVQSGDRTRIIHDLGKGIHDLVRACTSSFGWLSDVVVYPANEDEVAWIVDAVVTADVVVIPFSGDSNTVVVPEAEPGKRRQMISVSPGRVNQVLAIDEQSGLVRIQTGVFGPDIEEQPRARD